MAAVRHGVARIDRQVHDHLLELQQIGLDRPQVASMHHLEIDLLADQAAQHHGEIAEHFAEIENLQAKRLLARKGHKMPYQTGRAIGALPDLHDVLERRVGRLVRVEQEIVGQDDGGQHIVEVVRHAAGELTDQFHLLLLNEPVLELALLGGLQRIDNGRFLVALLFLDRRDIEAPEAFARPGQHGIDRRDVALALRGLADRGFQRRPVSFGNDGADRPAAAVAAKHALKQPCEQRVGAHNAAVPVDGGDRHRRIMKKAHEAHLRGALRLGAVVARAIEHERARGAGGSVRAESDLVKEANRQRAA